MSTTVVELLSTMEHLGDATSRNLEFSYRPNVPVSYGEETITETNLLELMRRHSDVVHLHTFSKHQESKVGADWEWYVVGRRRTLRIRMQAKRVTRNDVLRIRYTVGRSGRQQHDLLIQSAKADGMRPMYCIYCTESQRLLFRQRGPFQTGCLIADAENLSLDSRNLSSVERGVLAMALSFRGFPSHQTSQSDKAPCASSSAAQMGWTQDSRPQRRY